MNIMQYAEISFCQDLLRSSSTSFPCAHVYVGEDSQAHSRFAIVLVRQEEDLPEGLSLMERSVLRNVGGFIQKSIASLVRENPSTTPNEVLLFLQQELRGGLFVSKISEQFIKEGQGEWLKNLRSEQPNFPVDTNQPFEESTRWQPQQTPQSPPLHA